MANFQLGFEINLVIVLSPQPIARLGSVLTHHNDRRLNSCKSRKHQIHQDVWVRIKNACRQNEAVEHDPQEKDCAEKHDKAPASAKVRYLVREFLPEGQFLLEL